MDDITKLHICAWCQKEIPAVDQAIKHLHTKGMKLSHGMCRQHLINWYKQFGKELPPATTEEGCPNLHERPDLVQGYIELAQKNGQQNPLEEQLRKDRLQKLANIKK